MNSNNLHDRKSCFFHLIIQRVLLRAHVVRLIIVLFLSFRACKLKILLRNEACMSFWLQRFVVFRWREWKRIPFLSSIGLKIWDVPERNKFYKNILYLLTVDEALVVPPPPPFRRQNVKSVVLPADVIKTFQEWAYFPFTLEKRCFANKESMSLVTFMHF